MFSNKRNSADQSSSSSSIPPSPSTSKHSIAANTLVAQNSDLSTTINSESSLESTLRPIQSNPSMFPPNNNGFLAPPPPQFYRSGSGSLVNGAAVEGMGGAVDGPELFGLATLPNQPSHQRGTSKRGGNGTLTRGMKSLQNALLSPTPKGQQPAFFSPGFPPGHHHASPMNTPGSSHFGAQPGAADPRNMFAQMPDAEINRYFELMLVCLSHISGF